MGGFKNSIKKQMATHRLERDLNSANIWPVVEIFTELKQHLRGIILQEHRLQNTALKPAHSTDKLYKNIQRKTGRG